MSPFETELPPHPPGWEIITTNYFHVTPAKLAKEKTMARKLNKKQRKLSRRFFKLPGAKRRAGRRVAKRAAEIMGVTDAEFATAFAAIDNEEAVFALRTAASGDTKWEKHFAGPGEKDWEGFFQNLMACLSEFLPLILAL